MASLALIALVATGSPLLAQDEAKKAPQVRVLAPTGEERGTPLSEAEVLTPPATVEEAIAGLERQELSLVALLRDPVPLTEARARAAHAAVFGEVPIEQTPMRGIFGQAPVFLVREPTWFFSIRDYQSPYYTPASDPGLEKPFEGSDTLLEILRSHDGYRSVELVAPMAGQPREEAYVHLAPLLREATKSEQSNVVAIYAPAFGVMIADREAIDRFYSAPDPVAALEAEFGVSMIGIATDDPEMAAAVAEAKKRWPEFVDSLKAAGKTGDHFVKAKFGEEPRGEFLWVAVMELGEAEVRGVLMNAPQFAGDVAEGDSVVVDINDVNDWLIVNDSGERIGAFTVEVVRRRAGR